MLDKAILFCMNQKKKLLLLLFAILLTLPLWIKSGYVIYAVNVAMIFVFPAVGLTILAGFTGQVTMCQASFFGIGAYVTGILAKNGLGFGACFIITPILVALISALLAAPALRLKGHYLVLLSMGFAQIATVLVTQWRGLTGGSDGLQGIPRFKAFGLSFNSERVFFYFILVLVAAALLLVNAYTKSRYGIQMKTVKQDSVAAQMIGVNIRKQKMLAFIICGVLAGFGGALYASYVGFVSPQLMTRSESILILAMVTIGGMGSLAGTVMGAVCIAILPEFLRIFQEYYYVVFSLVIVLTMIYLPRGVAGFFTDMLRHARQRARQIAENADFAEKDVS